MVNVNNEAQQKESEKKELFSNDKIEKKVGRNEKCPCGSGKKKKLYRCVCLVLILFTFR